MRVFFISLLIIALITDYKAFGQIQNQFSFSGLIELSKKDYKAVFDELKNNKTFQNPDSALIVLNYVEKIAKQSGDSVYLAKIYSLKGGKYYAKGDYVNSLKNCNSSLRIYKWLNDDIEIAKAYNNLGIIYEITGDYEFAIVNHTNSLNIWNKIKNPDLKKQVDEALPHVYSNIGVVYGNSGNNAKAMEYYRKALVLANKSNQIGPKTFLLLNIGLDFSRLGNQDSAKYYIKQSLEISQLSDDKYQIANTLNNLGLIYSRMKNMDSALFYFNKGLKLSLEINALELTKNSYHGLYTVYESKGEFKKAIEYLNQSKTLEDSIYGIKAIRELSEMKNIEQSNVGFLVVNKSKNFILIIASTLLILSISAFWILYSRKRSKKRFEKLKQRSSELLGEANEKLVEDLAEMKNNSPQKLDDEIKSEILMKLNNVIFEQKIFMNGDLTLESLAKEIDCSRSRISHVINQVYGKNFNNWINEFRIEEAKLMMKNPENRHLTIEAISQMVGFNSKSTFNTFFKVHTGLTPSQFLNE